MINNTNLIQTRWIFTRALELINKYDHLPLSDQDREGLISDVDSITEKCKNNEYCRKIMLDVVEAFANEEKF